MTLAVAFVPLVTAVVLGLAVSALHRRLRPQIAARALAATIGAIVAAALPSLWLVGLGSLTHTQLDGVGLEWCSVALGVHDDVPPLIGMPALLVALVGATRVFRIVRAHLHGRCGGAHAVTVIFAAQPFAYTLPGCARRVVLSTGLLRLLDDREQQVVLAHERAHGAYRHDRFLLFGQIAEAAVPVVRPLTRRMFFALERWADEAAVEEVDGDRDFVAMTIARVAVGAGGYSPALGFSGLGAIARVDALLDDVPPSAPISLVWLGIMSTAVVAAFQLHHLAILVASLCH